MTDSIEYTIPGKNNRGEAKKSHQQSQNFHIALEVMKN